MSKKFLVFSPSYHPESGGVIALHKLCSLLNDIGYDAYLLNLFNDYPINRRNILSPLSKIFKEIKNDWFSTYKLNPKLNTKVLLKPPRTFDSEWVVVYPEIVFGNPLGAKNVARWMLYKPGFHKNHYNFGKDEYHIDFNHYADDFVFPGTFKSSINLYVLHFPFDHFNLSGALPNDQRSGTAYCVRKGIDKQITHNLHNSVLIDRMPLYQIASILKRVKTFISYDPYTAYSLFAVLCGAESVVVPNKNMNEEQWYQDKSERYGVAYGFENLPWARKTAHLVLNRMKEKEKSSIENARRFAVEVLDYFDDAA